ncbi:TetR/AcrR family transcriptional regulator [Amycolatopsis panacis]|uniref:TetR/AcrR family transcriptional regulator n=1 Tax=Amycolatopsis panacis TaxID=2340917 RepID=A0A419I6D0_9PSEU|nr:TetR/AcrR family transcriptional regulator [Amycolatopsis panacis]RJQ86807.1 TetR/AcrR family transcriptional regulator [Amycolatopsis panacis]
MARWEPNARERLVVAAVDLFAEQGYEGTAVAQIAERAGLTRTTFFRHFRDKREVLFAGQQVHAELLANGVAEAPAAATPLEAVEAGLDALTASFVPEQREFGPRLLEVTASTPELRERSVYKQSVLAAAIAGALRSRGVGDPAAALAADLGVRAFHDAYVRWVDPSGEADFRKLARAVFRELREVNARLE